MSVDPPAQPSFEVPPREGHDRGPVRVAHRDVEPRRHAMEQRVEGKVLDQFPLRVPMMVFMLCSSVEGMGWFCSSGRTHFTTFPTCQLAHLHGHWTEEQEPALGGLRGNSQVAVEVP